ACAAFHAVEDILDLQISKPVYVGFFSSYSLTINTLLTHESACSPVSSSLHIQLSFSSASVTSPWPFILSRAGV
ncbi:unnamed protein product, partial [Bubo scandiacus]